MKNWLTYMILGLLALAGMLFAVYMGASRESGRPSPPEAAVDTPAPVTPSPPTETDPAEVAALAAKQQRLEQELAAAVGFREVVETLKAAVVSPEVAAASPEEATPKRKRAPRCRNVSK